MAVIETWFEQDLQKPVKVRYIDGNLFSHNGNGNRIGVVVTNNGEPVTLTGSVSGYAVLADGTTVPCTGTRSGNKASILVPAAAYSPGSILISIFLTDGTTVTTLAALSSSVIMARTGNQISPGSVVTDWTNTINAAMQSVETAAANLGNIVATPYANLTFPVPLGKYTIYNNGLYRCISPIASSEAWTAAHWTNVKLGDDVAELKSAIDEFYYSDINTSLFQLNGIAGDTGANFATSARLRSIGMLPSEIVKISAINGYSFAVFAYDDSTYVGVWNGSTYVKSQSGAQYISKCIFNDSYNHRITIKRSDGGNIAVLESSNIILHYPHVLLDETLTSETKPAQAKATGLVVSDMTGAISDVVSSGNFVGFKTVTGISGWKSGIAINGSGEEATQSASYCSDFIAIPPNSKAIYSVVKRVESHDYYNYIAFYNSEKTFISRVGGEYKPEVEEDIPQNASYLRVSLSYIGIGNVASYLLKIGIKKESSSGKFYILGDSISAGYFSVTDEEAAEKGYTITYRPDGLSGVGAVWDFSLSHNYWGYANKETLHLELVNMATPGKGYLKIAADDKNGILTIKNATFTDAQLIVIAYGFNDWHYNMRRGDHMLIDDSVPAPTENYDTTQLTTVNHAIWYCLGEVARKAPLAKIVVQTPMNGWLYGGNFASNWGIGTSKSQSGTLADIHDDIKYWADYYGLQVLEMTYNNSIVNRTNIKTALLDGSHPCDLAHMALGHHVAVALLYK